MTIPAHWITPEWPAPPGVRAACSTREGGVSGAPWHSLNLGEHVGDDAQAVAVNRARYAHALGVRPVFLQQVHGITVLRLDGAAADGQEADGCVRTQPGLACTVMVADCLPILLCDAQGRAVAAAHAGWRGLAGQGGAGVVEASVRALLAASQPGSSPSMRAAEVRAWLGPCIGPQAFEVGAEVKAAFEQSDAGSAAHFGPTSGGKWLADLAGLARRRLRALGVHDVHGNDGSPGWCTVGNASRFFSHRRDGVSGRFAASVWLA